MSLGRIGQEDSPKTANSDFIVRSLSVWGSRS